MVDLSEIKLPAAVLAEPLHSLLSEACSVVVCASPGAGKSTLLPLAALEAVQGKIIMLEPRRLAAREIACRMAALLGEAVGETVGYRVRFDTKIGPKTRIELVTEGILTKMMIEDPGLDGVACLIFDEFHERSLNSDMALAMALETAKTLREDMSIVIMSATIDGEELSNQLGFKYLSCEGRMFPVQVRNVGGCADEMEDCRRKAPVEMAAQVAVQLRECDASILCFLPGEAEIKACAALLEGRVPENVDIRPLYGKMSIQDQHKAIEPSPKGRRKVVIASSIAETSLTIEGISCVIDSGLCRRQVFNPANGLSHMETMRISRDMATQRCGRAGRLGPGVCIKLWSERTDLRLDESRKPEIIDADLSSAVLDIASWGGAGMEMLPWITKPATPKIIAAKKLLGELGALDSKGNVTALGQKMAELPCHPRISRMLVYAARNNCVDTAAGIAALLSEKDPLPDAGSDICLRLDMLERGSKSFAQVRKAAEQFRNIAGRSGVTGNKALSAAALIASAYPERIACRMRDSWGKYMTAAGEIVVLDAGDPLFENDWLAIADFITVPGSCAHVHMAAALEMAELEAHCRTYEKISWDEREACVIARREKRIGRLLVASYPMERPEDCSALICEAARSQGLSMFDFSEEVANLQRRVALASEWRPELELPDLSTENVLNNAELWLPPVLGNAWKAAELKKIDLSSALLGMLSWDQKQALERVAPSHISLPSGKRIKLEYRQGSEVPVLRIRLQECFGMLESPRIDEGRRPVLMELLSPGFKPVQLTSDLHSFWTGTYSLVRKELRNRYPKHAWPENPLEAFTPGGNKETWRR